ncbi:DUF4836 family protein [Panacibacter sp. DH6]|uniref:DUF4836 family protein n=1 Tax=Panacibacter microcysteis TaxID=2793269 RepID=A0A931GXH0_9BACT|nr:DUF4836 family protein [Panacibacter microcysteis]MBG9375689.1 DUF4836 family protein [Panacibacter microcysteis]
MKQALRLALLFAIVVMIATSCKKAVPEQTKYIPKDALMVFDVNWKSLSDKAAKGNIQWDSLFNSIADKEADSIVADGKKKVQDFIRSGVDTTKDIFFFIKNGGSIMSGQQTAFGVVGAMRDASSFEAYIKKQPRVGDIQKGKDYSYAKVENSFFVGWNKEVVIVAGVQNTPSYTKDGDVMPQQGGGDVQMLATLFALKEEESVSAIPEFRDLMNEKGDMLFWSNSSAAFNSIPMLGMTKISDLFKDSYGAGVINFEDGKVAGNFKSYSGKDLAAIWDKYKGPQVDMSMVNQFPVAADGYAVFSFNPQIIQEIIKYGGFESTVRDFMTKTGFTMDEVLRIFKGDFAIVFGEMGMKDVSYTIGEETITNKMPVVKLVFNATIGDKAAYEKVMAKLAEAGEAENINGQYVPKGLGGMAWMMNGKNLIVATDSTVMQQYLAGKGNAGLPADVADRSKGKSMAFYADLNRIIGGFAAADTSAQEMSKMAQATFKNAFAASDNFNGKYISSDMELKMMNEKENSLVSLVKFFATAAQQAAKMQARFNEGGMTDMDEYTEPVEPPAVDSAE